MAREVKRAFAEAGLAGPPLLVSGDVDERMVLELRGEAATAGQAGQTGQTGPVRGFAVRAEGTSGASHVARYELVAIEDDGAWSPRLRVGEDSASSSYPGRKLLVRFADAEGRPLADVAHATSERMLRAHGGRFIDRATGLGMRLAAASGAQRRASVMRGGKRATPPEPPSVLRERALRALQSLDEGYRRIVSPARYPVGLTPQLASQRSELLAKATEDTQDE
jgi:nicotinate phosphoribosyltransferase